MSIEQRGAPDGRSTMLGPFDWYSAIEIGIVLAAVGVFVLIAWGQQPLR